MFMPKLTREDRYFRKLMEADAVVRPALIREWCRRDRLLGERVTQMFNQFITGRTVLEEKPRRHRIAV
jgi:hypothetical protein